MTPDVTVRSGRPAFHSCDPETAHLDIALLSVASGDRFPGLDHLPPSAADVSVPFRSPPGAGRRGAGTGESLVVSGELSGDRRRPRSCQPASPPDQS